MNNGVISYPIPPYQNVPIHPEYYQPKKFFIQAVTLGVETLVETTEDMDYVIGQEIRLVIPPEFGCRQLNAITGYVIEIPALNQVIVDIDSSLGVDPFILSSATSRAQILAIGDINMGSTNTQGRINQITYIPGSFINISPN